MTTEPTGTDELGAYPSIELAYPIAVASYDAVAKRLDSIDGRLQSIIAFSAAVFVAAVSVANASHADFHSRWFYLAALFFVAATVYGTHARLVGAAQVLNPTTLFNDWLHKPQNEFKKDLIFFAGEAFTHNTRLADRKWRAAVASSVAFLLQGLCLAAWVL